MNIVKLKNSLTTTLTAALFVAFLVIPNAVLAQDFAGTDTEVCGFLSNINNLLNMASIAVVTIAIIFCGYQIAFAHKRISDVAPILIGAFLIGAAGQVAKMIIGDQGSACTSMVTTIISAYA
ncbi:MAG: TrbC/VirB2 family protein [Xanthomonadaceae bacterium]|jgi:type IV secretion system protein VirB2|nr:TrbC/VirB2 family protein [Xanthomonadaceae bacterium]